ncbi:MAG: CheR family methyltransferase [Kofleriaceae bacterium]
MRDRELTPQLFAIYSALIENACGMHYGPKDRDLLGAKLINHAQDLGHESLLDYYYRLRYDDPQGVEVQRLVEALVVHETYFFASSHRSSTWWTTSYPRWSRARGGRGCGRRHARPAKSRSHSRCCSISAGSSTVELVATDISAAAVEQARTGRHSRRALRDSHPVALAQRYLDSTAKGITVDPKIRDAVRFSTLNLLDEPAAGGGSYDVILCRNVLIYFRDEQVARLTGQLTRQLAPGGLLAVGISESLLRFGTALLCEERGNSFFYRVAP